MPGYGVLAADEGGGLLPWDVVLSRLTASHDYWLASITDGTRPHVMPVWGVWLGGRFWFSSSNGSRKARNVTVHPQVTVTTDNPHQPVVLEGRAERVDDLATRSRFNDAVNAKYETGYELDFYRGSSIFRVHPHVVFALDDADFVGSPTRWQLDRDRPGEF
jgi:nitroimidazol reductase NimA-like FMN-containing flavoprotein (pyridoxamine 5'-phosphate oxidase superfamily)